MAPVTHSLCKQSCQDQILVGASFCISSTCFHFWIQSFSHSHALLSFNLYNCSSIGPPFTAFSNAFHLSILSSTLLCKNLVWSIQLRKGKSVVMWFPLLLCLQLLLLFSSFLSNWTNCSFKYPMRLSWLNYAWWSYVALNFGTY